MFFKRLENIALTLLLVTLLLTACKQQSINVNDPVYKTGELLKGFASAWSDRDGDKLLSYYSKSVKSYDATSQGLYYDYTAIASVLHWDIPNGVFDVKILSFFVSDDGRFAATVGTFGELKGTEYDSIPYVSLLEISEGQIVWAYDYYGGILSDVHPLQEIPESANKPASSGKVIAETRMTITDWEAAYNNQDAQTLISLYADRATCTDVVGPEWRVLTKDSLLQDLEDQFQSEEFASSLDNFFVSANGRFAAVQGVYADANVTKRPMVILLEVDKGKVVEQYNYLFYKRTP